ncbi:hypothetical protein [Patulibacter sp. SYSU D01012]|uniref:hypothetical protein n=1 Tax=Patulibacter sp. SYSU D01012 TaxID=2817381 RepID=UPI001B30E7A3|nr:hypothetical protein [Patulibacter sp. SYSU D01012]
MIGLSNDDVRTIGSVATTVGVIAALFGTNLRAKLRQPKLTLLYHGLETGPYWDHIELAADDGTVEGARPRRFWLRLRVYNAPGRDTAENVQVLVTSYRASNRLGLDPRPLVWSGLAERDVKADEVSKPPITAIDLPSDVYRHVDLIRIDGATDEVTGRLCVYPRPRAKADDLSDRAVHVTFAVTAKNIDALHYEATIEFDNLRGTARLVDGLRGPLRTSLADRAARRIGRRRPI